MAITRSMIGFRCAACLSGVLAWGCGAPSRSAGPAAAIVESGAAEELFGAESLAAARGIVDGLDVEPPESTASWRPGDEVLLGLVIDRGPARQVRFLKVASPPEVRFAPQVYTMTERPKGLPPLSVSSPLLETRLTLYDESGGVISSSPGQFPMDCIGRGAYLQQIEIIEYLESGNAAPIPIERYLDMPIEERREQIRRSTWLVAVAPSMGGNPAMRKLLTGVMDSPPLLSLLLGIDVAVSSVGMPGRSGPVGLGGRVYPAATMSLAMAVNGTPSLEGTLTAVPAVSPLHLCGGLVSLEARNPKHPERRVVVRLLGARRGPKPAITGPGGS